VTRWLWRLTPLLIFSVVYLATCVLGATLILAGYRPFIALYEYFSGTTAPHLTPHERSIDTALLAAPAVMWPAYVLTTRLGERWWPTGGNKRVRTEARYPAWLPYAVFLICGAAAVTSIARAGSFGSVHSWLDYGIWVRARAETFKRISFLPFVNIYLFVPFAAAWCAIAPRRTRLRERAVSWLPTLFALGIALLLFQKKAALTTLVIILTAALLNSSLGWSRRAALALAGATAALVVVYSALVVAPVYSTASHTVSQAITGSGPAASTKTAATQQQKRLVRLGHELRLHNRHSALALYSILSPLTRSSVPALYYPVIFPKVHTWYRFDVGLDIAGDGSMPDDNLVVWHYMNPSIAGTTMVPFNFVLYSQVQLVGTLLGCAIVGVALAVFWRLAQSPRWRKPWSSLWSALVILLAIYLAIDSARDSILVSYGVVWGAVFIALAAGLARLASMLPRRSRPSSPVGERSPMASP
jgi:hypothetical protein